MQEVSDKVQDILKEVSEHHEITIDELTGSCRSAPLVLARKDAYRKLGQAGLGPTEIGRALNRDPSVVTRALVEPKMCPKGHGELRREGGYAVCTTCGYEEPLEELPTEELPTEDPGKGKYADKPPKLEGWGRCFRYPEATKIEAVREVEGGADKEEVCQRVGCHLVTLDAWIAKYGGKTVRSVGENANGIATGKRVRGQAIPEEIKIQAVREYEAGGDPDKIAERVGCSPVTIKTSWFYQYGKFREREASIEVIGGLLVDLYHERGRLNKQLSDLIRRISALEMAKKIVEEAKEK